MSAARTPAREACNKIDIAPSIRRSSPGARASDESTPRGAFKRNHPAPRVRLRHARAHPPPAMRPLLALALLTLLPHETRARELPNVDEPTKPNNCPHVGSQTHDGCDDAVARAHRAFDMWELARAWTPGFCSTARSACAKRECARSELEPALTLHGLWPSYSTPASERCFWPQNCARPKWYPTSEAWGYDASVMPADSEARRVAPAWADDGLGAHEWLKHGTCAAWNDPAGETAGMTQREFYNVTFALARALGTPAALLSAVGGEISLEDAQAAFGGASRVALGCASSCVLVQAVQCFERTTSGGVGEPVDCPCVGVRDSRYDNSCAHDCKVLRVLSPEQTRCHGDGLAAVAAI